MQYQEKELFQGYEIKNWNLTPQLSKLFGAAAIFNILFLFVVVQAQVFTTRGCDSPLVGNFCQVLDTIYLGGSLLDTNTDFVSKDYQKTELEDAEITYIDVTNVNNQPLNYPEGYFALANPESAMMQMPDINGSFTMPPTGISGFPTNPTIGAPLPIPGSDLLAKPQVTPTPNPNAVTGKIDDNLFSFEGTTVGKNPVPSISQTRVAKNRPPFRKPRTINPVPKPSVVAQATPAPTPIQNQPLLNTDAVEGFKPNKKPLEDFADDILSKREDKTKPLDLTKNFKVRMIGELDKDGKLDPNPKKTRYVILKPEEQGDQAMVDIAKAAIEAINDGGLFYYLKQIGVDKVEFTLAQDDDQIYAIISSAQKTEERAKTMSSGMSGLLGLAKTQVKEAELKTLLDSAKSEQQSKNFVLNFKIDKAIAQTMITNKLQEAEAKKKAEELNSKPNSTAQSVDTNQKTAK